EVKIFATSTTSKNITIGNIISSTTTNIDGDISVYYKNLTTGESVIIDGDKKYYMASLYKVILTLYTLDLVKNGKAQLTDKIGDPPITIEEALNKIITESNNEYATILAETYGWQNIENVMKPELGIDFKL